MKLKTFSSHKPSLMDLPNLSEIQINSYRWLLKSGLRELFNEVSPIRDYSEKDLELYFTDYYLDEPKYDENQARENNLSYEAPLRVKVKLVNKKTGEMKEQEVFMADFPLMTPRGTFIVNGVERVVVSQIIRSYGILFTCEVYGGKKYFGAKVIPNRGAWLEFETDSDGAINVKIDRKRKAPVTTLLRAFGLENVNDIRAKFEDVDKSEVRYIESTLAKDTAKNKGEGLIEIYKRVRPGDMATVENARSLIEAMFSFERYDFSKVGRYKLNQRMGLPLKEEYSEKERVISLEDLILIIREIIRLNNNPLAEADDIDNLGNRRVRGMGELLQNKLRVGLTRMSRIIRDRMSILDVYTLTPAQLINSRPFMVTIREFFTSSQLSQFMDQVNTLSELEHKRRLSAMGPGGLTRERAGFEVRDVHPSHYGRICPIQTPEGPNIGLVGHLASFAKINHLGLIETPYLKVKKGVITKEIDYLDAFSESKFNIASAGIRYDEKSGKILEKAVEARIKGQPGMIEREKIDFIDVSPQQFISVATSMIPFLEHDDANRALMGSNMQRQAVPSIRPQAPRVGTGVEGRAARDSGRLVIAEEDGVISEVDANHIIVKEKRGEKKHDLNVYLRSNSYTAICQKPLVFKGQKVKKGDILADGSSTEQGRMALGQNLLVAFLSWGGSNYEDAVIINERLVKDDRFTSIHIEDFSCDVRDTKLGPEITTPDIPNVGEDKLKDLDEEGIVRIGAEIKSNDILVGKISPKGEAELTPEERLLRAIFGEKARDVKDTSKRLDHGKRGRVVGIKVFSREQGDKLAAGIIKTVQVEVAQLRKISVGDKIAGRHGNKGIISKVLPEEDMPYLEDGTPVDIILNPLGVASRMNLGQILETHLGWAARELDYYAVTPALAGVTEDEISEELKKAGLPEEGKVYLYNGQTGEKFENKVAVGVIYMMKLHHLVEDKIHMRSIGPYSLITQQPLGGKAQFGGQRFGEMEVWALEGYGASHALQEMLTIKSDDVAGRAAAYDAIIRGEKIKAPNIPASFNVLVNELKGLGLGVELKGAKKEAISPEEQEPAAPVEAKEEKKEEAKKETKKEKKKSAKGGSASGGKK